MKNAGVLSLARPVSIGMLHAQAQPRQSRRPAAKRALAHFRASPTSLASPRATAGDEQPPPAASRNTPPTCQTPSEVSAAARTGVPCSIFMRNEIVGLRLGVRGEYVSTCWMGLRSAMTTIFCDVGQFARVRGDRHLRLVLDDRRERSP